MALKKSPWVIHYDGSSCNGCDIEVLACLTPVYDVERLGIINTGNPKHADIFLLTGSINEQNKEVVQNIYNQMPDPKVVVAVGICATSGGIFADCYNILGGAEKVVPVDIFVPGCAARPESIIDGIAKALPILEQKGRKFKSVREGLVQLKIVPAEEKDAADILDLQRMAYRSEAEIYQDQSIEPLLQTLDEMKEDFKTKFFLKAVMHNKIVGSVRAWMEGDTCRLSRLIVHPSYQNFGIGKKLVYQMEAHFPQARRYELFTGHKSRRNIYFYGRLGYRIYKRERINPKIERVYLQKIKSGPGGHHAAGPSHDSGKIKK